MAGMTSSFGVGSTSAVIMKMQSDGSIVPLCEVIEPTNAIVSPGTASEQTTNAAEAVAPINAQNAGLIISDGSVSESVVCQALQLPRRMIPRPFDFKFIDLWCPIQRKFGSSFPWMPRCPPIGCLNCSMSFDRRMEKIPSYLPELYFEAFTVLNKPHTSESFQPSRKRLSEIYRTIPTQHYLTKALKSSALKSLEQMKITKTLSPESAEPIIESLNAIALDAMTPAMSPQKVILGQHAIADFEGAVWLSFREIEKSGAASLFIESGLPAFLEGFEPGWPIASYRFTFSGALSRRGYVDINVYYGGISFSQLPSTLHIFEWDGENYQDITSYIDTGRNIITGRTTRLSTYVIMAESTERDTAKKSSKVDFVPKPRK